ncbi:hypothetical protein Gpo141_00007846 [Globisporangium polare]
MDISCLHPYRKRKFFHELAQLLGEDSPVIRQSAPAPLAASASVQVVTTSTALQRHAESTGSSSSSATRVSSCVSSEEGGVVAHVAVNTSMVLSEEEESSLEYVGFDGLQDALAHGGSGSSRQTLPSQTSTYGSTQDSACLVPMSDNTLAAFRAAALPPSTGFRFDYGVVQDATRLSAPRTAVGASTELVNGDIVLGKPLEPVTIELSDYYDSDRLCEITPCWLYEERPQCYVHKDPVVAACPMLLFCLQVIDEFIAYHTFHRQETWRVEACKVAQCVFVARWDTQLLGVGGNQEIDLQAYLLRKLTLVGVTYEVWRLVGLYWDKYKQHYPHHQELYLADARADHMTPQSSKWHRMRDLSHIFGMKASQASQLAELSDLSTSATSPSSAAAAGADYLSTKHLADLVAGGSPMRFGIAYLRQVEASVKENVAYKQHLQPHVQKPIAIHRHVVSQCEWKVAFNAIEIHLQKWYPLVQVFACGSFSRGAAFGSTIDVLVGVLGTHSVDPDDSSANRADPGATLQHEEVIGALRSAKIVHKAKEHRVGVNRSLFAVPYKQVSLILDLKVYEQPKSWFALVYFTGPQSFVHDFFSALLQMPLRELCEVSFEAVYGKAVEVLGLERVVAVECEKDVFRLAGREYLLPSFRM